MGAIAPLKLFSSNSNSFNSSPTLTQIMGLSSTSLSSDKSMIAPPKILIAGAGIAGPAAAFWLARFGCDITIVERSPALRAYGQQVDLNGQGIILTKMMGIEEAVRSKRCPEPGMRFLDSQGRSKAFFPVTNANKYLSPTREVEIMRGDLVNILYDATKDLKGVKYVFGSHVESFTQDQDGGNKGESSAPAGKVHVTFSDGTKDNYDILIGADGIGSETRELMLGASFPDPYRDLGVHMAFFTAPAREDDDSYDWTVCHIPGGRCIMTRRDAPEYIRVYLATRVGRDALYGAKTLEQQKSALVEIFRGARGWQVDRFLQDLVKSPEAGDLYCQAMSQIRLPEGAWSRGRVVLLGDAAYCPAAIGGGVGTSASLIGAYVLAGEIAKQWKEREGSPGSFSVEKSAKEYERIVRPFIAGNSYVGSWMIKTWFPDTRFGIWVMHTMAKLVEVLRVKKIVGSSSSPQDQPLKLEYPDYFGIGLGK